MALLPAWIQHGASYSGTSTPERERALVATLSQTLHCCSPRVIEAPRALEAYVCGDHSPAYWFTCCSRFAWVFLCMELPHEVYMYISSEMRICECVIKSQCGWSKAPKNYRSFPTENTARRSSSENIWLGLLVLCSAPRGVIVAG